MSGRLRRGGAIWPQWLGFYFPVWRPYCPNCWGLIAPCGGLISPLSVQRPCWPTIAQWPYCPARRPFCLLFFLVGPSAAQDKGQGAKFLKLFMDKGVMC